MEAANSQINNGPQFWCFTCQREFNQTTTDSDDIFCPQCHSICALIEQDNDPRGLSTTGTPSQNQSINTSTTDTNPSLTENSANRHQESSNPQQGQQQSQNSQRNFLADLLGNSQSNNLLSEVTEEELMMLEGMLRNQFIGLGGNVGNHMGGAPPATKDTINRLKQSLFRAERISIKECSVCQEDYKEMDKLVTMPCDHIFHKDCLTKWLNMHNTCPFCRLPLTHQTEKPTYDYFS